MFVNTVPVRFNFTENTSFENFVKNVSQNLIGILRHQKYSYNAILEDIRAKFANIPNLYNIMFSYQLTKAYDKTIGNYKTTWNFNHSSANDIAIHIYDINDTGDMEINYDYLVSKYSEIDISNLHKRIIHIISQIVENPDISLNDIDIVTPEEKHKILYEFNNTAVEYPRDKTIIDLFEEQVEKTPDNIAVVFEDQKLTYKELNEKANSLAHYLRFEKNITRNEFVGIMVNRSLEMIISILAVLKSGATYIPIDPTYPKDRIDYMLKNSNAKILLTQNKLLDKINFENKISIDLEHSSIYNLENINLTKFNTFDDLMYIIYTSGSTGTPKGVMISHKVFSNFTNYCNNYVKYLKNPCNQAIASITTISFDIFTYETLISLQKGLKVVIANEKEQTNPYLLNKLLEKNNIQIIQSTPSVMNTFINNINEMPMLRNLQYVILAGEQLPLALVKELHKLSSIVVYNGYGPSETYYCTLTEVNNKIITIGKPIYNSQMYILDKNLHPVPAGTVGDIYISGDCVGMGYINNKELTSKSFIPNPFLKDIIMYKSGDIGKYQNDGNIICLGRSDHQVKLRGLRIELGEIEDKINSLSFITSCVVIKKTQSNDHEFLCAYFTSNREVNEEEIIKNIEKFLPKYMIPKYFIKLDSLPYTPNGKVDRKSLPEINNIKNDKEIIMPRNNTDIKLLAIIQKLLHIENISIGDDFLDIGGDSLFAITLSTYIQKEFGVQIFVKDILNNSKISTLSDLISSGSKALSFVHPAPKSVFYKTSSAQKRIYFASKVDGKNSILYNMPGGIILDKELDIAKLEKCFNTILKHQESLRTYFEIENEEVVQKIAENIDFKLKVLENLNFNNIDAIFKNFVKPFDLSKPPLFRAKYLKFTNGKTAIWVDFHHIISDRNLFIYFYKRTY